AYNVAGAHFINGDLDPDVFTSAFDNVLNRHDSLRTVFKEEGQGEVRQFILSPEVSGCSLQFVDLREEKEPAERIRLLTQMQEAKPFVLSTGPLLRANLYRVTDRKWVFSYVLHHIICDGHSVRILMKEMALLYSAYLNGKADPLTPLRIQYKDFSVWQQKQLSGESLIAHRDWWLRQFKGDIPSFTLPRAKPRPAVRTHNGATTTAQLAPPLSREIRNLGREVGGTAFMGLIASLSVLLHRYTGHEDIVIGTSSSSREHADLENQIGFYVNTLALRIPVRGIDNFRELSQKVKQVVIGAYEHQVYPFDELVNDLRIERDRSRHPLFDVMVVYQVMESQAASRPLFDALEITDFDCGSATVSKFDLTFFFVDNGEEITLELVYNKDIYGEET